LLSVILIVVLLLAGCTTVETGCWDLLFRVWMFRRRRRRCITRKCGLYNKTFWTI